MKKHWRMESKYADIAAVWRLAVVLCGINNLFYSKNVTNGQILPGEFNRLTRMALLMIRWWYLTRTAACQLYTCGDELADTHSVSTSSSTASEPADSGVVCTQPELPFNSNQIRVFAAEQQ